MLNMDNWVTPNHFSVEEFEQFGNLTPAAEFDLVAPILVYFQADSRKKTAARAAIGKLKKLEHPLVESGTTAELLDTQPSGLVNRYNALMMKLVSDLRSDAESYIDTHGAFAFRVPGDSTMLSGDASGLFAFYMDAQAVKNRVEM
jgi:hypothetical protein